MIRSLTSESTILANAAPMITPTARSTTLPFEANSLNSVINAMPGLLVGIAASIPAPCREVKLGAGRVTAARERLDTSARIPG